MINNKLKLIIASIFLLNAIYAEAQTDTVVVSSEDSVITEIAPNIDSVSNIIEPQEQPIIAPTLLPQTSSIPYFFVGTQPNKIIDHTNSLAPFFEKLKKLHELGYDGKPVVRIVQIGDSHVRSHEITPQLSSRLMSQFGRGAALDSIAGYRHSGIVSESGFPGIICHCIGINGATSKSFLNEEMIYRISGLRPDLIIISLGTNTALGNYSSSYHYQIIESLFLKLRQYCPNAVLLYTTPPGAYKKTYSRSKRRRNRKVISINENHLTRLVASTIVRFAREHNAACWDLFNIIGGDTFACKNWTRGHYFKGDKLHFVYEGYKLQGNLLYEALSKKYNEYISK